MKCPICGVSLKLAQRGDVEFDYCPQCHGAWLERGGIDSLLLPLAATDALDD